MVRFSFSKKEAGKKGVPPKRENFYPDAVAKMLKLASPDSDSRISKEELFFFYKKNQNHKSIIIG